MSYRGLFTAVDDDNDLILKQLSANFHSVKKSANKKESSNRYRCLVPILVAKNMSFAL